MAPQEGEHGFAVLETIATAVITRRVGDVVVVGGIDGAGGIAARVDVVTGFKERFGDVSVRGGLTGEGFGEQCVHGYSFRMGRRY